MLNAGACTAPRCSSGGPIGRPVSASQSRGSVAASGRDHRPVPVKRQAVNRPWIRQRFANRSERQGVQTEQFHPGTRSRPIDLEGYKLRSRLRPGKETPPGSSSVPSPSPARPSTHMLRSLCPSELNANSDTAASCVSVWSSIAPESIFRNRTRPQRLPSRACCRQGGTRRQRLRRHVRSPR